MVKINHDPERSPNCYLGLNQAVKAVGDGQDAKHPEHDGHGPEEVLLLAGGRVGAGVEKDIGEERMHGGLP